jgi:uncharacterized protein DUF1592/uncharacterized protein DUF1588/uncharacterized protein DUF1595/uncharacterized protein DUF1585/uncharacterized protein DUF1587
MRTYAIAGFALRCAVAAAALLDAGCTNLISGKIGDAPDPTAPSGPAVDGQLDDGAPGTASAEQPLVPAPASLRRLTHKEYTSSVRALFGDDIRFNVELEVDTPLYGFTTVGASSLTIGPHAAEQYEASALDLAAQVFSDPARRDALVGCAPATADDPCVRAFIATFGRRAWRRALTTDELDRWTAVVSGIAASFQDVEKGLELAVAGVLESPNFLYRVELGAPDPSASTRLRYTGAEMATRLSYFILGTTPDDALLQAAQDGRLDTRSGIEAEARRLLAMPAAHEALGRFFSEHLKLDRLEGLSKDRTLFPLMSPTLMASMRGELERLVDQIVFAPRSDFREVFITKNAFVNAELARLYDLPAVPSDDYSPTMHPANSMRSGILTTAAFLALNAHERTTSPTYRGRFIRQSLLCQEIPPPPPGVNTTLPDDSSMGPETLRQKIERLHLRNPTCAGCHSRMDPLGFGLENFDAIGAYRTTDNGLPIDSSGMIDGKSFGNARELAAILHDEPDVAVCMSRMAYRWAAGHRETDGEAPAVDALARAFASSGYDFKEMAVALVTSDGFRFASPAN